MAGALEITTPTEREIALRRVFDAPREVLFEAWTKPALLQQWLGVQGGWTFPTCEIDLREGGAYRYVWRSADGADMGVGGVFREVVPSERLTCTEAFDEPWYPGEALNTTTFVEQEGRTTVTLTLRYESREARDVVLQSPMEGGVAASYDRLAALLAERDG